MSTRRPLSLLAIRHGATAWNEQGRLQGQVDVPLTPAACATLGALCLPHRFSICAWWSSPLARAVETARLLSAGRSPRTDPRLSEMSWGAWEGRTTEDLREELGDAAYEELTGRGPDFRPAGGESPRELQTRVTSWMTDAWHEAHAQADPVPLAVVTHKGVLKALLGLAFDWNLLGKSPVKLRWECAHLFEFDPRDARVRLVEANVELERRQHDGAGPGR